jgi:adhesin HecA-like repeat protein
LRQIKNRAGIELTLDAAGRVVNSRGVSQATGRP